MPSNPKLINACKLWDLVTTKAYRGDYTVPNDIARWRNQLYSPGDYEELKCRIDGDSAELTVGASTGHRAHVNLRAKTLEYYDPRNYNNRVIWRLFKLYGIPCKWDFMRRPLQGHDNTG